MLIVCLFELTSSKQSMFESYAYALNLDVLCKVSFFVQCTEIHLIPFQNFKI